MYRLEADNHHFMSKVDHFTVTFRVNKLQELLQFLQAGSRADMEGFDVFDDVEELVASKMYLGYTGDLTKLSSFNQKYLPHFYNTLFTILNKCLTGKNPGINSGSHPMVLFLQGMVQNRYYHSGQLIFVELVDLVTRKNKSTN